MYFVYVIYNSVAHKFYVGQTKDLERRISFHNTKEFGKSYSSQFVGTWEVIYKEAYPDRSSALQREKQLKSYRGRQFIKNTILPR